MAVKKKNVSPLPIPDTIADAETALKVFRQSADILQSDPAAVIAANVSYVGNPISVEAVKGVDEWVTDQIQGSQNAGGKWERGIQHPSRDPKQAAIDASKKYETRTTAAIAEHRYDKGVRGYDLDEAINTALKVGGGGYAAGVAAREGKIRRKVAKLQPLMVGVKRTLDAMPSETDAQAEQKAVAAIKLMREVGKKMRE